MVKNSSISVISQKENEDLLHIWNCTKKTFHVREVCANFWENVNGCWPICKKEIGDAIIKLMFL